MFAVPNEIFSDHIIPCLTNLELSYFSCVSWSARAMAISAIQLRVTEEMHRLKASNLLNKRIETYFLVRENVLVKKIEETLKSYKDSPIKFFFFSCSVSYSLIREALISNLSHLEKNHDKNQFYANLNCVDKIINAHCIELLQIYEMERDPYFGPAPLICIDIKRNALSTGNLACFSIARRKMRMNIQLQCIEFSLDDYNQPGHKTIVLFSSQDDALPEEKPYELLQQLETEVSSLTAVRLLEIRVETDDFQERMSACFSSLLSGTIHLPHLKGIYLAFKHSITDFHMMELSEYMKKSLVITQLEMIQIDCFSLTLEQLQTLITCLDTNRKKDIQFFVTVPKNCRNLNNVLNVPSTIRLHLNFP